MRPGRPPIIPDDAPFPLQYTLNVFLLVVCVSRSGQNRGPDLKVTARRAPKGQIPNAFSPGRERGACARLRVN
jgi:hypothetical protein